MTQQSTWLEFLQSCGPLPEGSDPHNTFICDLSHMGLIAASGDEAESFLQNQFCNDVRQVDDEHSQLNGYCTAKGRLLAFFHLFKHNSTYYCALPQERLAAVLQRLKMFVLMTRVELADASDDLIRIGVAGRNADSILKDVLGTLPQETHDVVHDITQSDAISIIRVPGVHPRFMIIGNNEQLQPVWQKLAEQASPVASTAWEHQDILAGIPQVVDATAEDFVPQMLNLQSINALSFKKGCYPGQEIVARMHYLGKQKKRMYLAHIDDSTEATLVPPGSAILAKDTNLPKGSNNEQSVGTVVSSTICPSGGLDLLVVLQIAKAENASLHPKDHQNMPLSLKDLPYSVEVEGDDK